MCRRTPIFDTWQDDDSDEAFRIKQQVRCPKCKTYIDPWSGPKVVLAGQEYLLCPGCPGKTYLLRKEPHVP